MFNLKEFIINNLIEGVKNKSFTKEYASILAVNYLTKGIIAGEDIMRFDLETTEQISEEVEQEIIEESPEEIKQETLQEPVEETETEEILQEPTEEEFEETEAE